MLRRELGVLPPGDIRNCLAALSTEEPLLTRLFQYRFAAGSGLRHSFGNLFLSAYHMTTGNLETAITASSRVLAVQGQVVPATNVDVQLWAELETANGSKGKAASATPAPLFAWAAVLNARHLPRHQAIANADLIVLGPGSLYTSCLQSAGARTGERHQTQPCPTVLHPQPDDPARRDRWPGCARSHPSDRSTACQPRH